MTDYAIKAGYDQALIDLVALTPQPASNGIQYTVRDDAVDGSVSEQGPFIELRWSVMESITEYTTLLTQFGLNAATTVAITLYCPSNLYVFTRYNGIAVRPEAGKDVSRREYLLRDVVIIVRDLELST